jgi:4-amino-4-deoxy-L-arabinose transferase-like glycosyltransferase
MTTAAGASRGPTPVADGSDVEPALPSGWERVPGWRAAELLAIFAVTALAVVLRIHEETRAPQLSDNQDPLQFAWSGMTLFTRHIPYAWEVFQNSYRYDYTLHLNGTTYHITHPWFSHPPLFSILVGGWAYLTGARDFADVTAATVRPVAVFLSIASLLLAYLLVRRLLGRGPALVGVLALAVSPGAVLMSREVETEALLAPLMLLSLLLVHDIVTSSHHRLTVPTLLLLCVAMPLTKVTGIVIAGTLALILLSTGHWRVALACGAAGAAGLALFALYGAYFDWALFLKVLAEWRDEHRHGVMAGLGFISESAGIGGAFHDGWYHLGWIGLGYLAIRRPSGQASSLLAWPCLVYAAGVALLGDAAVQGIFGWYRIVLYPLLYAAAALLVWEAVHKPSIPAMLAVMVLAGATATEMVLGRQWKPDPYILATLIALVVLPAAISHWRVDSVRWRQAGQLAAATAITAILAASAMTSWILGDVYRQL